MINKTHPRVRSGRAHCRAHFIASFGALTKISWGPIASLCSGVPNLTSIPDRDICALGLCSRRFHLALTDPVHLPEAEEFGGEVMSDTCGQVLVFALALAQRLCSTSRLLPGVECVVGNTQTNGAHRSPSQTDTGVGELADTIFPAQKCLQCSG